VEKEGRSCPSVDVFPPWPGQRGRGGEEVAVFRLCGCVTTGATGSWNWMQAIINSLYTCSEPYNAS
jgi:hypothetical protein